ncbi:MAG TPA: hypothetical protein VK184_21820 [Nostocaceae cyanobacterium]|nr:hypothetical protein [Nostocaceae cyanobacterium]
MNTLTIRAIFHSLCGLVSALLGWSISQILWQEIGGFLIQFMPSGFSIPPYVILLVIITPFLACGMVMAEVFLSNPTSYKSNWRVVSKTSLKRVFIIGAFLGLQLSGLNWLLLQSNWSGVTVRIVSWVVIGAFAGLAESVSWSWRSIDSKGNKFTQRMMRSTLFGGGAALLAAIICEGINKGLGQYREVFGFLVFGSLLGWALCFSAIPRYQVALRAGKGFEAVKPKTRRPSTQVVSLPQVISHAPTQILRPTLNNQSLKFIPDDDYDQIEEGLSIQLPVKTAKPLIIGSGDDVDIYIPHLPLRCASIDVNFGSVVLRCLAEGTVQVQQKFVTDRRNVNLKHNQILTFYYENEPEKFYRFVFYDRLLDPQA